jgi:dCTP deaminase
MKVVPPERPAEILRTEVLERAIRLLYLVKRSTRHLSITLRTETAQTVSALQIQTLLEHHVIAPLLNADLYRGGDAEQLDAARALLETVAMIHEGALPTVPRVTEPIELRSYLRQGGTDSKTRSFPLVFASERLGMQVYPNSLAGLIDRLARRQKLIAKARHQLKDLKELATTLLAERPDPYEPSFLNPEHAYIAIPAIDIHNPNRWPSLWHELAHQKLVARDKPLLQEFEDHINGGVSSSQAFNKLCTAISPLASDFLQGAAIDSGMRVELGRSLIERWLRECWCDAYGVQQAGVAFLYSQLHDFMFCFEGYLNQTLDPGQAYPPAEFRLRLAKNLALERLRRRALQENSDVLSSLVEDYETEEILFFRMAGSAQTADALQAPLSLLYSQFAAFLKLTMPFGQTEAIGGDVSKEIFDALEVDLREGLPIPAITSRVHGKAREARVSEIVLAGWRYRNSHMRADLHRALVQAVTAKREGIEDTVLMQDLITQVGDLIERTDESIKRSIQVAEWFSILHQSAEAASSEIETAGRAEVPGLLSDGEIGTLLDGVGGKPPTLRIIPLINRSEQVKGSAIDLRLGHNFEVFQALTVSAIDACDPDSLEVEVDFLEGLPVLPGQFVLAHTLEYIKLPGNIAAQIEGRSSFARLGIQVHMTANLVEAGFDGCLTLEILNSGPSTVVLYPGMRVAQLRMFRLAGYASRPYGRTSNKYRGQLSHNKTKQFSDPEVEIFRRERAERAKH